MGPGLYVFLHPVKDTLSLQEKTLANACTMGRLCQTLTVSNSSRHHKAFADFYASIHHACAGLPVPLGALLLAIDCIVLHMKPQPMC